MHRKNQKDEESVCLEEIARLEAEMGEFALRKSEREREIRQLRETEDPAKGVSNHVEIFQAQQDRLRLDVEIELRRKKINRLKLGYS
jgi:hypothetical protein